jgi:hypothetical protein
MVIRQARIYLAGGISLTALIGAAVVAFVVLVSLQTLRDWPLNGVGEHRSGAVQDSAVVATPAGARGPTVALAPGSTAGVEAPGSPGQAGNGAIAAGDGGGAPSSPATVQPAARAPSSSPETGLGGSAQPGSSGNSAPSGGPTPADVEDGIPPLPQTAAGTVNETVAGVNSATGGALGNAGVTETAEEVVNGAAGPKSAVGRAVDRATEAVGGLPGEDR